MHADRLLVVLPRARDEGGEEGGDEGVGVEDDQAGVGGGVFGVVAPETGTNMKQKSKWTTNYITGMESAAGIDFNTTQ